MEKRFISLVVCITLALFFVGCAAGKKFDYHGVTANINVSGNKSVGIATQDARPWIISEKRTEAFVGIARGGFGEPFDVVTQSGRAIAKDMSLSLENSLSKKGFKTVVIDLSPKDSNNTALKKLISARADRLVLLKLHRWRSDTFSNTTLTFNVDLKVMNGKGKRLAEKHLEGVDDLGGRLMNPWGHAERAVPIAFKQKLEELFSDPKIQKSLK